MQNMIKIPTTTLRVRGMEKKLHHQVRRPTQFRIDNVKPGGARG